MTGVTFNNAAGATTVTSSWANVGSQSSIGPTAGASELTASWLASGTIN